MKKIIMYATSRNGDGSVMKVGVFEDMEDIEVKVGMFSDDVVITFENENDNEK